MYRWFRLVWLLAALGGAGILVVHSHTSVVTGGYRLSGLIEKREKLRERNRVLRIEMGRASVPAQVRKSLDLLRAAKEENESTSSPAGPSPAGGETRTEDGERTP